MGFRASELSFIRERFKENSLAMGLYVKGL